ncbi:UTRA domain-containing protein [Sphingosinicella microcystinivorans]|uniref:GntR family transcriptional regulator n=1 Tax=Sphingosinicella microcystinivorans TaxID=335406 RepID=A0ABX9SUB1_SPHMI|nr:UTRA domain-containing protein [Sphingosinicella microcystinivorans]RKS84561.1 GntR family transcriptional regulator [Sphingosinicella microcystinivorans]
MKKKPLHTLIRQEIEQRIMTGEWKPGHRIPFEHELMVHYDCARMTVNRALAALSAEGLIVRRRKAGSFVAAPPFAMTFMAIQDFGSEAERRGKEYRYELLLREKVVLTPQEAARIEASAGGYAIRLRCRHLVDGSVIAVENRTIALDAVPEAGSESFDDKPPSSWLLTHVPWTEAEHTISATIATPEMAKLLGVEPGSACLVLERRTWANDRLVTDVIFHYPANQYTLKGRFQPQLTE